MSQTPASWDSARAKFQQIWGYEDFRPPQGEVIASLLNCRDALVVMPTGAGKSVCFQLPALLQSGLTLVVSPLVALMENQVTELLQRQLPAAQYHSELSSQQRRQTLWALERHRLRLLYLSPESLLSDPVWQRLCEPKLEINGLILDEAHCLVQWGETFRPAYRRLGTVRPALLKAKPAGSKMAIAAFTATADPQTQQTIQCILQLQQPEIFRFSPYRPNLHLQVQIAWTPRGRRQQLLKLLKAQAEQAGLIYTRSRRETEALAVWLGEQGYRTAAYHAGLGPTERRRVEAAWLQDQSRFVICTCAFGMGINKPDVRWIFHFHAPALLSEYVQEIGRAGRDGKPAQAVMLISEPTGWLDPEDQQRQQFFQNQERQQQQVARQLIDQIPAQGEIKTVVRQLKQGAATLSLLHSMGQLEWQDPFHYVINRSAAMPLTQEKAIQKMAQYSRTKGCRWKFILEAFGFAQNAEALQAGCGHCDRCLPQQLRQG